MTIIINVDIEAIGPTPFSGVMTEFGAVELKTKKSFHGILYTTIPNLENSAVPLLEENAVEFDRKEVMSSFKKWLESFDDRVIFISDNPAYDFMWIAYYFDSVGMKNPFGHSGRRLGDLYSGVMIGSGKGNWKNTQGWKKWRKTKHDHNPVNDSMGNIEALETLLNKFSQIY